MEKPGLGYGDSTDELDGKPFSIRRYVLMSREKNIAQNWPFSQKYLDLCLDKGIKDILPPMEIPSFPKNDLHGKLVIDISPNEAKNNDFGKICGTKCAKTEKGSKPAKDSSVEDAVHLLSDKLGQLSLSFDGNTSVGTQTYGNTESFKANNSFYKNTSDKGRRRKGKAKMKSLTEILAVAKHCNSDSNDRMMQNADEKGKRKVKGMSSDLISSATEPKEGPSMLKEHQICDDSINDSCKSIPWSSCEKAETEKKPGGYKRKAIETYDSVPVVELQDHHAR